MRAVVALTPEQAQWVAAYTEAKRREAEAKQLVERCRQVLEAALGDAEIGLVNNQPAVRWTHVSSQRLDTSKLKEDEPEVYERYTVLTTIRQFTVTEPDPLDQATAVAEHRLGAVEIA